MSPIPDPSSREPGARLERALELFLSQPPSTPADGERLLDTNPDLRDLLEPMLAGHDKHRDVAEERVLGDFRLVRELGRGGMGIVYEAWQRSIDRRVAVKVLSPALVSSPNAVARFRREAAAAGRLRHPNIVEVFGFGSDGDRHFFAMQLVVGESLQTCMARFREPKYAVELAAQLADALVHAHAKGLVHRDVKPANVLVREDRTPMLTDFGIASDESLPSLTREGGFLGTLDYASPEQVRGETVDARTDVWAVGVLLHELIANKHPFSAATQAATLKNILTADPPSLRSTHAISSDLAAVVGRALEKDLACRYASASALLADLRALQSNAEVSARLPTAAERIWRWTRREPWRAVAGSVLLVAVPVVAGTLGYLWANAPRIEAAAAAETAQQREALLTRARWQLQEDDAEGGLRTLAQLPVAGDAEAGITRALMLRKLDRVQEARAAVQTFSGETVELVRAFLDDRPAPVPAIDDKILDAFDCSVRADLLLSQATQRGTANRNLLQRSMEMANLAVALAPAPRLTHLITLADAARRLGDRAAAGMAERALAQHFPDDPVALRVRARTLSWTKPEAALALLANAVTSEGWLNALPSMRGVAYETLGRLDEAAAANREAIALRPNDAGAWTNLGVVLRKQKNYAESAAALQRAIELRPSDAYTWNAMGLTRRSAGDPIEARQAFERASELRPDYSAAAYNLGNLLMGRGEFDNAVEAFERAVAADPDDVKAISNLGDALLQAGRKQEALPVFLRATQRAPKDLIPHFNLAHTAIVLGLPEIALPAARRARELDQKGYHGVWIHAEALLAQNVVDAAAALADARTAEQRCGGKELAIRIVLARAIEANGDRPAAIAMLEEAQQEQRFAVSSTMPSLVTTLARMRDAK